MIISEQANVLSERISEPLPNQEVPQLWAAPRYARLDCYTAANKEELSKKIFQILKLNIHFEPQVLLWRAS